MKRIITVFNKYCLAFVMALLCSDKGVMYSTNKGASWYTRSTAYKNFVDLNDAGKELLATSDDGHLYYSTNKGASWYRRR